MESDRDFLLYRMDVSTDGTMAKLSLEDAASQQSYPLPSFTKRIKGFYLRGLVIAQCSIFVVIM